MHIPSAPSKNISHMSFSDALMQSGKSSTYDPEQWIYIPDFYTEYRYILGTRGENPLICVGINPSTAEPNALDNTLKSVERIAKGNGFDSFIMFNVYAQRATRPEDMDRELNTPMHRENMAAFRYILESSRPSIPSIWAAWGNIIEMRAYLPQCVKEMILIGDEYGAQWYTAGPRSRKGHPHHPLYLRKDSALESFNIREYCDSIL